jgi:hypothetical protein
MGRLSDWWQRRRQHWQQRDKNRRTFSWLWFVTLFLFFTVAGSGDTTLWQLHNIERDGTVIDAYIANQGWMVLKPGQTALPSDFTLRGGDTTALPVLRSIGPNVTDGFTLVQVFGTKIKPSPCNFPNRKTLDCVSVFWNKDDQRYASMDAMVSQSLLAEIATGQHVGHPVRIIYRDNASKIVAVVLDDLYMLRREAWRKVLTALTIFAIGGALAAWDLNRRPFHRKRRSLLKHGLALRRFRW